MNSKTKLTLSITAMVMVTLIAVVSIIAVFAARTQKFSSSIKVSYTSREVIGTASAKWLLGGVEDAQWQDMTNGKSETTLDFSKQLDDPTLSPGQEIPLTEPEQYAILEYNFTNDAPRPYSLNLKYTDDETQDKNVKVTTWVTPLTDLVNVMVPDDAMSGLPGLPVDKTDSVFADNFTGTIDTVVLANSKFRIYILVKIDNIGADASFSGNFTFNLDGTKLSTYDETFTYYTNGESATITGVAKGTPVDLGALLRADSFYIQMLADSELTVPEQYNNLDIKTIGAMALAFQMNLTSIKSFGKLENLYSNAFLLSGLSGPLTIPGTVKNINGAFAECTGISSLTIQNGVENIGSSAFASCEKLSGSLLIPESVITIGEQAFFYCDFDSVQIGGGVRIIEAGAFYSCFSLNKITIDSKTVCDNLISWEQQENTKTCLLDKATTVNAKYEVVGLEEQGWTKNAEKEGEYWVYTKN